MTPHEPHGGLRRLLAEAVDDIEPRSGIEAIRSRTHSQEATMNPTRTWLFGGLAAAAVAAVIGGVSVLSNTGGENGSPDLAETPTGQVSTPPTDPTLPVTRTAIPVYYVGESARGLGLYREFQTQQVCAGGNICLAEASARTAVTGAAEDPDYRNPWPDDAGVAAVSLVVDTIEVDLTGDLHDRPAGMSEREAQLAIQQVIYSVQAGLGEGRPPVQFLLDGSRTDQVLGQPTSEPLAPGAVLDTLAHVNLSTPGQDAVVTGDSLEVTGVANSFENNVPIRIQRFEGTEIVLEVPATAEGGDLQNRLYAFAKTIDVSALTPGRYLLTASTDDASGGLEGWGPDTDSKVFEIR